MQTRDKTQVIRVADSQIESKVLNDKTNSSMPATAIEVKATGEGEPLKQVNDEMMFESEKFREPSGPAEIKCSAVHTLERDMPTFDYSKEVAKLRELMLQEYQQNPGIFSRKDLEKLKLDDWFVSRFLLRHKLDLNAAFDMMRGALRYRNESLCSAIRAEEFPAEFYLLGGLFRYEPDRKGNKMLYLRVKLHRKVPEIQAVLQAFIYFQIQTIDEEADGKGISIVFDCSGGGLQNADMETLSFFISTLNNYFPKGLSYLLVHELPWILKPIWHIAKNWVPEDKRQLIKFSDSRSIFEFVDKENLPDFMGGTCKRNYRQVPDNCSRIDEAAKLWGIEKDVVKKTILKFAEFLPQESLSILDQLDSDKEDLDKTSTNSDSDQENKP